MTRAVRVTRNVSVRRPWRLRICTSASGESETVAAGSVAVPVRFSVVEAPPDDVDEAAGMATLTIADAGESCPEVLRATTTKWYVPAASPPMVIVGAVALVT